MLKLSRIEVPKSLALFKFGFARFKVAISTVALLVVWNFGFISVLYAQEIATGTSARQLRKEVVRSLPYAQLNAETKAKIGDILERPSLYRRLPVTAIAIDPEYLQFLIRYPETVVGIWDLMGITKMKTQRAGPYLLKTDDGAGTTSAMELVYGSPDLHIYFGDGHYEGPVLRKKLKGKCVIILRTRPHAEHIAGDILGQRPGAAPKIACQLDVFLKLENGTAGIIAKTISPIVGPTADHNFTESLKFVERLNRTTVDNGPGVQKMAERLDVDQQVIENFQAVAGRTYDRAVKRATYKHKDYDFSADARVSGVPTQPHAVTAPPFSSARVPDSRPYAYQQQSYQYPLHGRSDASPYHSYPAGGSFFDSSSVQRAILREQ